MKKTLLIGAAVMIGFAGYAQNNSRAAKYFLSSPADKKKLINPAIESMSSNIGNPVKNTANKKGNNSVQACSNTKVVSTGPNAFGVGGGYTTYRQTCLSYNMDLNRVIWTHRRSANWAIANPMSSGSMQSDWLNLATGLWDSTIIYNDPSAEPGRYPGGTFYNPSGNTNLGNAFAVGTGPVTAGGAWSATWYHGRRLSGTYHNLPGTDSLYTNHPSSIFGTTTFMNTDMSQVGNRVLVSGEKNDTSTSANANNITVNGGVIGRATFATTGAYPTWRYDSITPPLWFNRNGSGNGYASDGEGGRLAFGPDHLHGFWVMMGRLCANYGNSADSALSPVVYSTTDGGITWTGPLLPGYDWAHSHPECLHNLRLAQVTHAGYYRPAGYVAKYYTINYRNGVDVTVDANNVLHLVGTVYDQGLNHIDSLAFSNTYAYDYHKYHPIIYDFMTDGTAGYGWKTLVVDSVLTGSLGGDPSTDSTATPDPVINTSPTTLGYGARVQVTRSTDGTKLIYSWAQSDSTVTGTVYNSAPDIWMKGYDVTNNKFTASTNVTAGIGTCFFHMASDLAYFDNTSSSWVAPFVWTIPGTSLSPGVYDGIKPVYHNYSNCGAFNAAAFSMPATKIAGLPGNHPTPNTSNCPLGFGIQSNNAYLSTVNAYPNPFNTTTNIVVTLNESNAIYVNVYDAIGNLVAAKHVNGQVGSNTIVFDGSSLNAGVYYYTVTAGYDKVTKKLIIQK